jgi:hypothetical protein
MEARLTRRTAWGAGASLLPTLTLASAPNGSLEAGWMLFEHLTRGVSRSGGTRIGAGGGYAVAPPSGPDNPEAAHP